MIFFFLLSQCQPKEGTDTATNDMGELGYTVGRRNTGIDFCANVDDGNNDHG